jgi:hypothetical protein
MSLYILSLGVNKDVICKLFPPRESLVSDIPAGERNIKKLFLPCTTGAVRKFRFSCRWFQIWNVNWNVIASWILFFNSETMKFDRKTHFYSSSIWATFRNPTEGGCYISP